MHRVQPLLAGPHLPEYIHVHATSKEPVTSLRLMLSLATPQSYVLASIVLETGEDAPAATGGVESILHPWELHDSALQPVGCEYTLPAPRDEREGVRAAFPASLAPASSLTLPSDAWSFRGAEHGYGEAGRR